MYKLFTVKGIQIIPCIHMLRTQGQIRKLCMSILLQIIANVDSDVFDVQHFLYINNRPYS